MDQSFSYGFQSIGLCSDILGAILLFKFGLPKIERTGGAQKLVTNEVDAAALSREQFYDFWGKVGLVSLLLGFALQLVPNAFGWWNS